MITDILYRCPSCGNFDWYEKSKCRYCNARVEVCSRNEVAVNGRHENIPFWYGKVLEYTLTPDEKGNILSSPDVTLSREVISKPFRGRAGMQGRFYTRELQGSGTLRLKTDSLVFKGGPGLDRTIAFPEITSVTIESHTLIVVLKAQEVLFFDFESDSGKKWEDCLRKAIENFHSPEKIVEFHPRIRTEKDLMRKPSGRNLTRLPRVISNGRPDRDPDTIFHIIKGITAPPILKFFKVKVEGLENFPEEGPALVLSNHISLMDSIILGLIPQRHIWYMAKNSQFKNGIVYWFMKHAGAFPVRRYTTDLQAVRNAIRVVQEGHILGIFPEGERSWDGRMLPFRLGTIRLALSLGVPVIPVGISGSYELMPRWTSTIRRLPVTVRIGAPLEFEPRSLSSQTSQDIERFSDLLRKKITQLAGDSN